MPANDTWDLIWCVKVKPVAYTLAYTLAYSYNQSYTFAYSYNQSYTLAYSYNQYIKKNPPNETQFTTGVKPLNVSTPGYQPLYHPLF
jgi:hypothetical protein